MHAAPLTHQGADMADRTPQTGDMVLHHGHLHEIKELQRNAALDEDGNPIAVTMAVFENGDPVERDEEGKVVKRGTGYRVKAAADELVWSEDDGAWYLPGRVLTNDERTAIAALIRSWPPAETHIEMRRLLDAGGPLTDRVDLEQMKRVVRERRLGAAGGPQGEDESPEDFDKRVADYAARAIAHAEEHRLQRVKES